MEINFNYYFTVSEIDWNNSKTPATLLVVPSYSDAVVTSLSADLSSLRVRLLQKKIFFFEGL